MWSSGRGAEGAAQGVLHYHGLGVHTQWAHIHIILGGGEDSDGGKTKKEQGVGHKPPSKCLVNRDVAPLTEPSYDCLSSSTLPAEHGPHCLPCCNTTTDSHTFLFLVSVLVRREEARLLGRVWRWGPGQAFFFFFFFLRNSSSSCSEGIQTVA